MVDNFYYISGMKNIFKTKHRIISDDYSGYEVQVKRFIFPFWVQCWDYGPSNTFSSCEDAKNWVKNGKNRKSKKVYVEF